MVFDIVNNVTMCISSYVVLVCKSCVCFIVLLAVSVCVFEWWSQYLEAFQLWFQSLAHALGTDSAMLVSFNVGMCIVK